MIHLELIFVWGIRFSPVSVFSLWIFNFSSTSCWKSFPPFPPLMNGLASFSKINASFISKNIYEEIYNKNHYCISNYERKQYIKVIEECHNKSITSASGYLLLCWWTVKYCRNSRINVNQKWLLYFALYCAIQQRICKTCSKFHHLFQPRELAQFLKEKKKKKKNSPTICPCATNLCSLSNSVCVRLSLQL